MAKKIRTVLTQLSTAELKQLLVARERIDVLDKEKARLLKELAAVERELQKLMGGKAPAVRKTTRRKTTKKKAAKKASKKKVTRKKTTRKKTTRKKAAKKKAAKKKAAKKKVTRKTTKRKVTAKKAAAGRVPLEDVVVSVLKKAGGQMSFQDLLATIVKGKLYKSKSAQFDNVLRRTLSTSKKVKRVGRGVYAVA